MTPRKNALVWRLAVRCGAWLERYVKNPQKPEPKTITTDQALVVR